MLESESCFRGDHFLKVITEYLKPDKPEERKIDLGKLFLNRERAIAIRRRVGSLMLHEDLYNGSFQPTNVHVIILGSNIAIAHILGGLYVSDFDLCTYGFDYRRRLMAAFDKYVFATLERAEKGWFKITDPNLYGHIARSGNFSRWSEAFNQAVDRFIKEQEIAQQHHEILRNLMVATGGVG